MKKIILILFLFIGSFVNAQVGSCTNTPCYPFHNTDWLQIYQAIRNSQMTSTVNVACDPTCTVTVKQAPSQNFTITPSGTGTVDVRQAALTDFTMTQKAASVFTVQQNAGSTFTVRPLAGSTETVTQLAGTKFTVDVTTAGSNVLYNTLLGIYDTEQANGVTLTNLDLYASSSIPYGNIISMDHVSNANFANAVSAYNAAVSALGSQIIVQTFILWDGTNYKIAYIHR